MNMKPFAIEIPYREPVLAFAPFAANPHSIFLDSPEGLGRYAYFSPAPEALEVASVNGSENPWDRINDRLNNITLDPVENLPPFQTGIVGYLGYEMGRHLERVPPSPADGTTLPEMIVGVYHLIAAFDTKTKKSWVIATPTPGKSASYTASRASTFAEEIANGPKSLPVPMVPSGRWKPDFIKTEYNAKIQAAIEYIKAGDIFQTNLTQRFCISRPPGLSAFDLYLILRARNPAPFAAYINCGKGRAILSASPERFLKLKADGLVLTEPIKGSRPRGKNPEADQRLATDLKFSEKDMAENLMIVDLLRNDLSKVCEIGSVMTPSLFKLKSFAEMHHLVSTITGKLKKNENSISLMKACFPGGSVTGAPKIRAMEIIHELESTRRGPYCGAIGWFGYNGAMDSSIVIRTLIVETASIIAQAGGGIVADSSPELEYDETLHKVRALLRCLDPEDHSGL